MDVLSTLLPRPLADYLDRPAAEQFPGRRPDQHRFDAPGGTLVHDAVCDATAGYARSPYVANDGGGFAQSDFTDAVEAWAHREVLELLGADGGSTVFGANMTTLTALFTRALRPSLGPGDEIVCTTLDHEANRQPWLALAAQCGATVRLAQAGPDGALDAGEVARLLGPRTRWVAVTAASNALGTVPDLPAIVRDAHAAGARVHLDAVQSLPHRPLDVAALGVDAIVTSAYKWYGPHLSVLWLSDGLRPDGLELAEQVPSAGTGGGARLSLGTQNHEGMVGLATAARVLRELSAGEVPKREQELFGQLLAGLRERPGVRVLGHASDGPRVPVVSFQLADEPVELTARRLNAQGVSAWYGSFYAKAALRAVSPERPEAVRAGIAAYTTAADVEALLTALDRRP